MDEILKLIESVSEVFLPTFIYLFIYFLCSSINSVSVRDNSMRDISEIGLNESTIPRIVDRV